MMLQQGQINPITDEKSFNAFYKEYKGFVYKVALQFTGCSETAKDVRQYVFMRIWINRTKIDPVQNVKSYVFICTRNEALNVLEKQRENDVRLETDYFAESISTQGDLKFEIETRLLYESVRKAAKQILPLQCRLVYQLIIEEDEDYLNVAQALNLSPSTVKNQKINARRKLKRFVGGEWCLSKTIE